MSAFPGSPRVVKGGIVLIDPDIGTVMKVIPLQYNPDSMTRTLQIRGAGEAGDRTEALRLTGPPVESIKVYSIAAGSRSDPAARTTAKSESGSPPTTSTLSSRPSTNVAEARSLWAMTCADVRR